jgi:hypothetical protein
MTDYERSNYRNQFDLSVCSARAGKHITSRVGIPDEYMDGERREDRIHFRIGGELVRTNIENLTEEIKRRL